MKSKSYGFTIVELLIVIVIIGILAAISIVSYTGIITRANDTIRRDGGAKLEKAYRLYMAETGNSPLALDCGYHDQGTGWIQISAGSVGSNYEGPSCIELLAERGYINSNFTENTPPVDTIRNNYMYMIERCYVNTNSIALLWHVENPSDAEVDNLADLAVRCRGSVPLRYEEHGMNSGVLIEW